MLADRLRELRLSNGLGTSQQYISSVLNIKQQTYATYENGTREPNIQTLIKLADYFHVSVDYLIDNTPYKNSSNAFDNIKEWQQDKILELKELLIRCCADYEAVSDDVADPLVKALFDAIKNITFIYHNLLDFQRIEGVPPEIDRSPEILLPAFTSQMLDSFKSALLATMPYLTDEEITVEILSVPDANKGKIEGDPE
jgi:transcriptional regulator with XRE-family HTH domain